MAYIYTILRYDDADPVQSAALTDIEVAGGSVFATGVVDPVIGYHETGILDGSAGYHPNGILFLHPDTLVMTRSLVGLMDFNGVYQGPSGILDLDSIYYPQGILTQQQVFAQSGIWDGDNLTLSPLMGNGIYILDEGFTWGMIWIGNGILDSTGAYFSYGILPPSEPGGSDPGVHAGDYGILDVPGNYHATGIFDGANYYTLAAADVLGTGLL